MEKIAGIITIMKKRNMRDVLDDEERFGGAPHWIVEFQTEYDDRNLTPLEAVQKAASEIKQGHGWIVTHVRSGLKWSVDLGRQEVIEVVETMYIETKNLKT